MEAIGESSSARPKSDDDDKPLIVRVKRKASHSPVDAFWLEINERPLKRPILDFEKLSISDAAVKENELKIKRVLVKHVESTNSSEADFDLLQSFLPRSAEVSGSNTVMEERRRTFKKDNIQEDLLSKAREAKETIAKNARFEQIWSRRKGSEGGTNNKALLDMYQFYDVVRVDGEEKTSTVQKEEELSLDDQRMLSSYLPMLREFIPSAAAEIESDLKAHKSKQGATDGYIYDYYTLNDNVDMWKDDSFSKFPLVQVDEDDFYDEPDESDMESYDSNAENNPLNDYPEEESEEEIENEDSDGQSKDEDEEEEESAKNSSSESEDFVLRSSSDIDASFEDVMGFDDNVLDHDHEEGEGADWRWSYR
ncbi:RNA-directed DNA methylation 4-like [Rhodamnia argentea]|uniref:RNA-directed DNA methylation 4-like n=1 Tax=Rhodamnia argentea TaxID=178133 RepID=A0A8B8QHA4_9MYRT|nr:RNA-directed DNA methylation 4-like [Rhodamnia argentea]